MARPFDKAESGLSEWATNVKAMHRQPDEEADQKRLEDEIAASRLARLRRSQLGSSRTNSLDLSKSKEYSSALRSNDATSTDDPKSLADRQKSQADALNKLMGSAPLPPKQQPTAAASRPEPMSLAAFMGGKATGPRLNRHAPQQDAHDPTQFVQTRINGPHPIFGRGGIALPGLVTQPSAAREADTAPTWSRPGRTPEPRDRRRSTPSPEKPESPPVSPQRSGVRERTMSTPTGPTTPSNNPIIAPQPSRNPTSTAAESRAFSTATRSNGSPAPSTSRPFTPGQQPSSQPLTKSSVVTPSLARPIQPDPRSSPQGPQISVSQSPSIAFLRAPAPKDPTPSLSRLQGRGFVQNMVKASSQLESPTSSPGSTEKSRPTSGRKSSVLDRWPGSATSPPPSPTAAPMRRSRTVEPSAPAAPLAKSVPMTKSLSDSGKTKLDEPVTGLGSARTVVVIQPKVLGVDELGFKRGDEPPPRSSRGTSLPEPTKPLIHPTKDRAKKPKKNKTPESEPGQSNAPQSVSMVSTSFAPTPSSSDKNDFIHSRPLPSVVPSTASLKPAAPDPILPTPVSSGGGSGMVGRRALPGMTQPHAMAKPAISPKPSNLVSQAEPIPAPRALPGLASAASPNFSQKDDASPFGAHNRFPSSGRPTAMDVAQALADPPRKVSPTPPPPAPPPVDEQTAESSNVPAARPRNVMPSSAQAEKRKSSYDRYSMFLPPLKEEATPDPTPVSTLTRAVGNTFVQPDFDLLNSKLQDRGEDVTESIPEQAKPEDAMIHFTHVVDPLPRVNISPLLKFSPPGLSTDSQTIQVDVMAIAGSTAFPLGLTHVFYETEILAIIHRSKSNSTGLINSTVWSWQGKSSSMGSSEERKLAELAKRYGTVIVPIRQLSEPLELVQCLGGTLSIRQGSRAHWANDNTAMHIVRSVDGVILIDQVDLGIKNISSGFSACVSVLNTLYVWHGCGSPSVERNAAMEYGRTLSSNPDDIVVLIENESDDDEMFWMVLGDEAEYPKADYWKWRSSMGLSSRIWSVDAGRKNAVTPVFHFRQEQSPHSSVYILDCVYEFFVLIPSGARGKRRDIRLALSVALDAADRIASDRPYTPTVHALILPSQLPVDLRIQFRDLEDTFFSDSADVPEHMNILSSREAQTHLQTSSWAKSQLKDKSILPLGLDESHIS